jgi:Mg2+/Co2+ transporter CorC
MDLVLIAPALAAVALLSKALGALLEDRWLRRAATAPDPRVALASWFGTWAWAAAGIALLPLATPGLGPISLALLWGIAFLAGEIAPRVLRGDPPVDPPVPSPRGPGAFGSARAALAARWLGLKREEAAIEQDRVIERLFRFRDLRAADVMVPLVDLSALDDSSTVGDAVARIRRDRYSRIPIFHVRMFAIVGVVHSIDLVGERAFDEPVTARMRPAYFVPATKAADALLVTMRYEGVRMAVVVDEWGGAVGVVSIEDLLERIVGEIDDEYDGGDVELVREIEPGRWRTEARLRVARANERLGWDLPDGPYETIGGLLLHVLGRIPVAGEEIEVAGHRIAVVAAEPRGVREVEVTLPAGPDRG